ncbi:MAG: bifunctional metallophosphatase/5'-nucleotidase [Lachnospiraceae bacterium]|nr:bifunctional metallophosphatase/5'-nucleotidase [Lachnospiraceae bacterium]
MRTVKKLTAICLTMALLLTMSGCSMQVGSVDDGVEKNGELYILFTSDVHCGVEQGFGYAGLQQIRDTLEEQGYETLLVDNGDAIQGESIGTLSKGEAIIDLMNDLKYDVATIGNHEFDYGMDRFLELTKKADFPYVSCNFNKEGELLFAPYVIKEAAGHKIAFIGVTTPMTIVTSTPKYFEDEQGNFIYGFMQDKTGEKVYEAVQKAVDDARAEGAELVYVLGHLGLEDVCKPWTYADVIANTNGIDVFLDGHSHDTEQLVMKNKDGVEVPRSAVGYKLDCIGYSHISADGEILKTNIWSCSGDGCMADLMDVHNEIRDKVEAAQEKLQEELGEVVATTDVELTINDPVAKDDAGEPIRMIRRAETNLGDLCADAYRDQSGADIAFVNGGGIRTGIEKGDITYGDIINVHPFGNMLCVIKVTGQQIWDALEWGAKSLPDEDGGFVQVSGLTYEIRSDIESGCVSDENGMFERIAGAKRRVQNVMIGDEPLDPKKTYTLAGHEYMLLNHGDGFTMFDGCELTEDRIKLDNQVLIDYIVDTLGGTVGEEYADPCGQGRIKVDP